MRFRHTRFIGFGFIVSFTLARAFAQPMVVNGGVINEASFAKNQPVSPGALVAIFGSNLSTAYVPGDTIPLSDMINNTSVTFNGIPAPLLFVSTGQINAQMPWEALPSGAASGMVNVVVTSNGVKSAPVAVQLAAIAPGVYSIPFGVGYAVAVNYKDGSLAAPVGAIQGFVTHPASVNDELILYATGLGPLLTPVADGADSMDATRYAASYPTVLVGGQQANVLFAGMSPQFPGVNQINFYVPQVAAGNSIPLQLSEAGITTTDQVVIAVQ